MSRTLFYFLVLFVCRTMAQKLDAQGGFGGEVWDDGIFDSVKKVYVGDGIYPCIGYVKFEYETGNQLETREHGKNVQAPKEFTLEHPHEYITSVEGTYGWIEGYATNIVTSLTFKTSKKRTSPTFGFVSGTTFVLSVEGKGDRLVGFHGRAGDALDAIGATFAAKH